MFPELFRGANLIGNIPIQGAEVTPVVGATERRLKHQAPVLIRGEDRNGRIGPVKPLGLFAETGRSEREGPLKSLLDLTRTRPGQPGSLEEEKPSLLPGLSCPSKHSMCILQHAASLIAGEEPVNLRSSLACFRMRLFHDAVVQSPPVEVTPPHHADETPLAVVYQHRPHRFHLQDNRLRPQAKSRLLPVFRCSGKRRRQNRHCWHGDYCPPLRNHHMARLDDATASNDQ